MEKLRAAPGGIRLPLETRYAKYAEAAENGAPTGFPTPSRKVELYSQTLLDNGYPPLPEFDGHHIQITLADFSGPHRKLLERGLITEESDQHQYRFIDIVDVDTNKPLHRLEHAGLLESTWDGAPRRRRVYALTAKGRTALSREREEWRGFARAVGRVAGAHA